MANIILSTTKNMSVDEKVNAIYGRIANGTKPHPHAKEIMGIIRNDVISDRIDTEDSLIDYYTELYQYFEEFLGIDRDEYERQYLEFTSDRAMVRTMIDNVYATQKNRIATGNRITQVCLQQSGVRPGEKLDSMDGEVKSILSEALREYSRVTDAYISIFSNRGRIEKAIEYMGDLHHIQNRYVYGLIDDYNVQLVQEKKNTKLVDQYVKEHPMWELFFKGVSGCGPLMTGVCLSYLNPYKARHVSGFWKYAGLDVVWEPFDKNAVNVVDPRTNPQEYEEIRSQNTKYLSKHVHIDWSDGRPAYDSYVVDACVVDDKKISITTEYATFSFPFKEPDKVERPTKRNGLSEPAIIPGATIVDYDIVDLKDKVPADLGRFVGRTNHHLVDREYIASDGQVKLKKSLTYNKFLKSKLMGVLANGFIKCPGSKYEQIYRGYRARLDNMPAHYNKVPNHKHMMALRYTVKIFLQDLWVVWRAERGLPVSEPYAVAKLGLPPHGFNY